MNTAIIEKLTVFFDARLEIILAMPKESVLLHRHTMTALYWYEDYYPIYKRRQTYILEHAFKK